MHAPKITSYLIRVFLAVLAESFTLTKSTPRHCPHRQLSPNSDGPLRTHSGYRSSETCLLNNFHIECLNPTHIRQTQHAAVVGVTLRVGEITRAFHPLVLLFFGQHDDHLDALLHHHLPKVCGSVWKRALSDNVTERQGEGEMG